MHSVSFDTRPGLGRLVPACECKAFEAANESSKLLQQRMGH